MASGKNFIDELFGFLASVKLALVVIIALAVAAIGGTVIPQNLDPNQYIQGYGPRLYTFLSYLDMFDMYGSWWFRLLLGILVVNLIVCSAKRLPGTIKLARAVKPEGLSVSFLERQSFSKTFYYKGRNEERLAEIKASFAAGIGRPREVKTEWGTLLYREKGGFSRLGAYIVHLSILIVLAGGVIGGALGFSAVLSLSEGQTAEAVTGLRPPGMIDLPFALRLDKFTLKLYPNGQPSEYRSDVTILENGREVVQTAIRVNHPMTYKGVTIYLSSFGPNPDMSMEVKLTRQSDGRTFDVRVEQGRPTPWPEGEGTIELVDFTENIMDLGPGAKLVFRPEKGRAYAEWALKKRPDFIPLPPGAFTAELKDYHISYYGGFQVNRDPGVWLVWIGCGMMIIGFMITFFFAHQKLFLGVIQEGENTRVVAAGSSHRNRGAFKIKFEGLTARLSGPADEGLLEKTKK